MGYADKMKTHVGTKVIKATPITKAEYNKYRGWEMPENEDPNEEGYLVEYPQPDGKPSNHPNHKGYISWSPKFAFDEAYKRNELLTFGLAVELMKKGYKMSRKGWNGRGMFAVVSPGFENLPADRFFNGSLAEYAKENLGGSITIRQCFLLKTAQDDVAYWAPSVSDALAEDWVIVGEPIQEPKEEELPQTPAPDSPQGTATDVADNQDEDNLPESSPEEGGEEEE